MLNIDNVKELQTFGLNFVIAGATSSVAKTIVAPIDRIKLILQNQNSAIQILTGERKKYEGFLDCLKRLPKEQGFLSFWRGNGTNLLRYIPTQALNFSFNDFFKHCFLKITGNESQVQLTFVSYLSGGCAGACATFTMYPLKFCQTRLSVDMGSGSKKGLKGQSEVKREFQGLADCVRKITKIAGISGLYRGFTMALMGAMTYRALYFGLFDNFKNLYTRQPLHDHREASKTPILLKFFFAQSITTIAGLLTYPFDTAGRRVMLDTGRQDHLKVFNGTWTALKVIYVNEGINAFYRGALTNCLRGIGGAMVLVFYDEVMYYTKWKQKISSHSSR